MVRIYSAILAYRGGRPGEGPSELRDLESRSDPMTELPVLALAVYLDASLEADVRRVIQACIDAPEGSPTFLAEVVEILLRAKRLADAKDVHHAATKLFPEVPVLRVLEARIALLEGDKELGRRIFQKLPRGYRVPQVGLGRLLWLVVKRLIRGPKK